MIHNKFILIVSQINCTFTETMRISVPYKNKLFLNKSFEAISLSKKVYYMDNNGYKTNNFTILDFLVRILKLYFGRKCFGLFSIFNSKHY